MDPLYVGYTAPVNTVGRELLLVEGDKVVARWPTLENPDDLYPHAACCWVQEMMSDGTHAALRGRDGELVVYRRTRDGQNNAHRGFA